MQTRSQNYKHCFFLFFSAPMKASRNIKSSLSLFLFPRLFFPQWWADNSHFCMMVWPTLNEVICWSVKKRILFPGFWIIIQMERRPRAACCIHCYMTTLSSRQVVVKKTHGETRISLTVKKLSPGIQNIIAARAASCELCVWKGSLLFVSNCGLAVCQGFANPMHLRH